MQIAMLGPLDVRTDADGPCAISGVRLARLLSVLALQPGRVVSTTAIVDAVWGDAPPAEPGNAVQALVSRLRRATPGLAIMSRAQGYLLDIAPDAVDVIRFERLLRPPRTADSLRQALDLWRGPALADAGDAEFAASARARLDELRLTALQDRIAADLRSGSPGPLVAELEGLVAAYPLREPLIRLLMRALHAAGDRGRALTAYDEARKRFADELGIAPSAELAAEHLTVLRADAEIRTDAAGTNPMDIARTNRTAGAANARTVSADGAAIRSAATGVTPPAADGGGPRGAWSNGMADGAVAAEGSGSAFGTAATGSPEAPHGAADGADEADRGEASGGAAIGAAYADSNAAAPGAAVDGAAAPAGAAAHHGRPAAATSWADGPGAPIGGVPGLTNLRTEISSFVGRDADIAEVDSMLSRYRLITLIGPGGAGKTRLAAHSARRRVDTTPGGVWMVEFAPVTDPGDVAATVLADLGIRDSAVRKPNGALPQVDGVDVRERLIAALSHRNALLVFDNCEHLIDATASLAAEILGTCPGIRILATSREPLGVVGEMLRPVEPLALPDADWTSIEQLIAYPSIRLFAQRAAAVRPGFAVITANAEAVVTICRALDGMPLAIELAAARMRAMSPDQIAGRLGDRFATLTAGNRTALPRHQTLRAVVDWSWALLEEPEQVVWRRLAMFSGGATLAAVEAVCADRDFDPLTVLGALVDKSLLTMRDEEAEPRYIMLETIRAYGLMRLDEAGERRSTRAAHAAYFRDFADVASRALLGRDQFEWLGRLRADHDNLNTAIRNAIADGDAMTAIRLTGSAAWYWWLSGHRREGAELVGEAFEVVRDDDWEAAEDLDLDDPAVRSALEWRATAYTMGALLAIDSDVENLVALEWFDRAVAIVDRLGRLDEPILRMVRPLRLIFHTFETAAVPPSADIGMPVDDPFPWVAAMARVMRAHVMLNLGRMHNEAEADFRSALEIFRSLGEAWGTSFALLSISTLEAWRGEIHEAIADIHEAMGSSSRLGMWEDRVGFRTQLVRLLWLIGDEDGAREELELAARDAIRVGVPEAQGGVAHAASELARFAGDLVTAESEVCRADELLTGHTVPAQFRAYLLSAHGFIAADRGRLDEARRLHMEAVRVAVTSIDAPVIAQMLVGLAEVALAEGDARMAATVLGASTAVRGMPDLSFVDGLRITDATIRALGPQEYEVAYARGLSGTVGQLAELVDVPMDGLAALPAVGDAIAPAAGSGNRGI